MKNLSLPLFLSLIVSSSSLQQGHAFSIVSTRGLCIDKRNTVTCLQEAASTQEEPRKEIIKPIILDPFLPAADPKYLVKGAVGEDDFIVSRKGGPTDEELSDENLFRIIERKASDLDVNTLVWKCLGYRFDANKNEWTPDEVFPKWKERFPTPPDFIGMQRIYSKEIDGPSLRNNQSLVRSIPAENKASYLKKYMLPFGFTGYKVGELTPNLTRRAQCINWLLFYREELYGFTVEELQERRRLKREKEEQERLQRIKEGGDGSEEWKPPVKEVF